MNISKLGQKINIKYIFKNKQLETAVSLCRPRLNSFIQTPSTVDRAWNWDRFWLKSQFYFAILDIGFGNC